MYARLVHIDMLLLFVDFTQVDYIKRSFKPIDIGPTRKALTIVIPITIVYTIIFISGVIGNVCTCAVIIRNK